VPKDDGTLATVVEGGSKTGQGHPNRWLGYLLVDHPPQPPRRPTVTADTKIVYRYPGGQTRDYTIADMIRAAKLALRPGDECGWSLIGLTAFPELVPFDEEWDVTYTEQAENAPATKEGDKKEPTEKKKAPTEKWSIRRIVEMETNASVLEIASAPRGIVLHEGLHGTSCGGTHRLIGLSVALQRYRKHLVSQSKPPTLEGDWQKAENLVALGVETIRQFQQEDGAFSALWLQRPSTTRDITVRIRTTGHSLEFVALTLSKEELEHNDQDWVGRAALHLCDLFDQTTDMAVDCGAMYHALHALQIYREKRWGVPN
jgi:hypothetical protein